VYAATAVGLMAYTTTTTRWAMITFVGLIDAVNISVSDEKQFVLPTGILLVF